MLVTVSPAFARWQVDDESDGGGFLFIASQVDETDTIEVQLVCDEMREGKLLFSVFTGTEMAKQKYAIPAVPITVRFGAVAFENLEGEVVGNDVERILDVSEVDEPRVRDLAAAMRKGKDMTLTYRDEEWLLTGENAAASLDTIFEHCP
ncbi:hypothetical protein VW35_13080 [Devosia soli]|uniref:Uncharacterized protein n=2 Tax=Devosia soli TaxID=361041 RepID=A0A0F5L8V3_9HYPH|nr:hypothetical protein VW35_13080 [Devosia soli]